MTETSRSQNRASRLRNQRTNSSDQRASQAAERARHPVKTPPVMVRGMAGAPGARRRVAAPARRRYYYSLGASGAEIRLPAISLGNPGWRLLSGAMSVFLLVGIWAMWSSSMFQISKIKVVGNTRIPAADFSTALDLEGASILEAVPADMEETLRGSFPDLDSVSVQVGMPSSIVVKVKERTPVIAWQAKDELRWIDKDGMSFPARGQEANLVTVQAEGDPVAAKSTDAKPEEQASKGTSTLKSPLPQPFISPDLIAAILKLSEKASDDTPILYDTRYGLGWNDTQQGWKVYFGTDTTNVDLKLQQYQAIVDEIINKGIRPAMISVEFPHAPFYRMEP